MYIEIQVASNFIASLLYNRLPRRRVNIFSEELEKALREKFTGHWYPSLPEKGSGFRCIKVGRVFDPPDAVLNKAAVESGTPINEIVENLPEELTLWIDPGEVSYCIGERKPVKVLYFERASSDNKNHNGSSSSGSSDDGSGDSSGKATVLAIDAAGSPTFMSDLEDTCTGGPVAGAGYPPFKSTTVANVNGPDSPVLPAVVGAVATANASPVMNARLTPRFKNVKMLNNNTNGMMNFATRCQTPTFTTASFAQTKFGSTKLKTNSKRTNRMSPTEFSNYIKQRAQMQQMNQNHPLSPMMSPRPLSPQIRSFGENYFFASNGSGNAINSAAINGFRAGSSGSGGGNMLDMGSSGSSDSSSFGGASTSSKYSFLDEGSSPFFNQSSTSSSLSSSLSPIGTPPASLLLNGAGGISDAGHSTSPSSSSSSATSKHSIQQDFDFLDNLNFAANSTAANSYNHPYQQLLLAN